MRMVDNGTDWTLQRKLPVHVDKLPCGRQTVCHCMPHTSHYSSPYHHHSSTRPLSLPLLQPSPTLHTETAHWHRIPHPDHHGTHSTHCHCKTRKCNSWMTGSRTDCTQQLNWWWEMSHILRSSIASRPSLLCTSSFLELQCSEREVIGWPCARYWSGTLHEHASGNNFMRTLVPITSWAR